MEGPESAHAPRPRVDVEAYPVRDELVLYCPAREAAFALNRSSRAIWDLCDGRLTEAEIAERLARRLSCETPDVRQELRADVASVVAELRTNGLLEAT